MSFRLFQNITTRLFLVLMVWVLGNCTPKSKEVDFPQPVWVRDGLVFETGTQSIITATDLTSTPPIPLTCVAWPQTGRILLERPWKSGEAIHLELTVNDDAGAPIRRRYEWTAPQKPTPQAILKLDLEDALALLSGNATPPEPTVVQLNRDGTKAVTASSDGSVAVIAIPEATVLWRKQIAQGYAKQAAFSPAGDRLYVGEQSRDGLVFSIDLNPQSTRFGETLWQYRLTDDLGGSRGSLLEGDIYAWVQMPGPFRIHVLDDGDVIVLGCRSWEDTQGGHQRARVYRFSPEGERRWAWPRDEAMPLLSSWFDVSNDGTVIAVGGEERFGGSVDPMGDYQPGTIYLLNEQGLEIAQAAIPPLAPFFKTVYFWRGIAISPDGSHLLVATVDGRLLRFDLPASPAGESSPAQLKPAWSDELATPFEIGGVPVLATLGAVGATKDWALVASGGSYIVPGIQSGSGSPPGLHPNGLALFGIRWPGEIAWQFSLDAATNGLAIAGNGRFAAVAVSSDAPAHSPNSFQGVSLFQLDREGTGNDKFLYTYITQGAVPYSGVALSQDGLTVALLEKRLMSGDNLTSIGSNQIHILR